MNKRGLGRGLGALIPETSAFSHQEGDVILSLPVEAIETNPTQPRRVFPEEEIDSLADSIRTQGLLQPIVVRKRGEATYQLIAGERRWRAAVRAGFEHIPAILRETADDEMLPLALVENLMREDLNPIEEALAYQELSASPGWTQEEIAHRVGKGRAHIANTLRLLQLPTEIREKLESGVLTRGHGRALLACRGEKQMRRLLEQIVSQDLSVREAEERAAETPGFRGRVKTPGRKKTTVRSVSPETRELEEKLQRVYGTPVRIHERDGRGRVSLEFYSYDDLARLTELLMAAESRAPNHL